MFKFPHKYLNELTEGGESGSMEANMDGGAEEGDGAPEYFVGDFTQDEAAEQLGYLRQLPDVLRGLESRVTDQVSPVMERLQAIQESVGSQPVFDPKLEKVKAALDAYDPKLSEALLPALLEDLKGSMAVTPLGKEILEPHIQPYLQETISSVQQQMVPAMLSMLPFDSNAVVNRDPMDSNRTLDPSTELQKDFQRWWEQADAPTRKALETLDLNYVQALQQFGKWRAERIKGKGDEAGAASARLKGAAQRGVGGRREKPAPKLNSFSDGFNSVFAEK